MIVQKFGLELRKFGTMKSLYQEVDLVLKQINTEDTKADTVAHALQKMLRSEKHLNICLIKECAEICQVVIPKERLNIYNALHCMSWNEMLPEYRQKVIAYILDDFRTVLNKEEI